MGGDALNGVRFFKTEEAKEVSAENKRSLIESEMIWELCLSRRFSVRKDENQRRLRSWICALLVLYYKCQI